MTTDHAAAKEWAAKYTRHTNPWGNLSRAYLALADAARWKAALERYGRHTVECVVKKGDRPGYLCTCGLSAALTAPAREGI